MEAFFTHRDFYPVLALLVTGLCVAVPFIAHYWYKIRSAEMELSLKHAMVERGMSAAEICAVLQAGASGKSDSDEEARAASSSKVRARNQFGQSA
jgi:hypothetical protein